MKQILQNIKTGRTEVADVPAPAVTPGNLLIKTSCSLISAGTERMLVDFGRSGWIKKARSQPDRVRQVMEKMRTDGIRATVETVRTKLDQPLPLGYSNAGVVIETGPEVTGFKAGDRVVSNGPHAEIVSVPRNLCAKIPDSVADEAAVFTVLGAIGLQGIRLAGPDLGESVCVMGLGLVGLITVQLLCAGGCRVIGFDFDENKVKLAGQSGAEAFCLSKNTDPVRTAMNFSGGRGVDAVLITAATSSSEPVHQAAQMSRKRGRIVLVGVTGLELSRADFYEKELSFQVSCSYGPGRYDTAYEQKGQDYPHGFVRWTAQRNFEAVLDLMARGRIDTGPLITDRFSLESAGNAYAVLVRDRSRLGMLLTYPGTADTKPVGKKKAGPEKKTESAVRAGMIGAGSFASAVLIPALEKTGARLVSIASIDGTGAAVSGRKFGFEQFVSNPNLIFENRDINTVFIATPHNTHASLVTAALSAGKHVFVEKPLAMNEEELAAIQKVFEKAGRHLMVGFNRRFSPFAARMKHLLADRTEPIAAVYTVNAGFVPPDHWTRDPETGGGRIIGEACHFIDFILFLTGRRISDVQAMAMGGNDAADDTVTITLRFEDGSTGTVHYFTNGNRQVPKENIQVFSEGRVLVLDNFRTLRAYGFGRFKKMKTPGQEKGHREEIDAFVRTVTAGGDPLMSWEDMADVTRAAFRAAACTQGK